MYEEPQPAPARGQVRVVVGVAVGVVVLALLGFTVGYLAFHGGDPAPTPTPVASATASPSTGVLAPLALPDYAGKDFVAVRTELRSLGLGVRLYFGAAGDSPAVVRTDPAAGTPYRRGITVKVYVTGAAPLLALPDVTGRQCNDGGKALADAGVYPQYPTGRQGVVVKTDPAATATTVHWNDNVKVVCARPGTSPSPVPSSSATSPDPDASPPPDSPAPSDSPSPQP